MSKSACPQYLARKVIYTALAVTLTVGCQNPAQPSTAETARVESVQLTPGGLQAGLGIKEIKLGQKKSEVEKELGQPGATDSNEFVKGQTYLLYHDKGIELTLQDDVVEMITVHAKHKEWSAYAGGLTEGVGPGSTAQEVVKALGPAEEDSPRALKYPAKGLWFRFDANREGDGSNTRVESVSVIAPEL